jgi:hypothetical protein
MPACSHIGRLTLLLASPRLPGIFSKTAVPVRTAYNGHFGCTCYHPLFLFNQFGHLEGCSLGPGNVHNALAYNLGNFMRTLALPKEVEHWSLTTLREKLV